MRRVFAAALTAAVAVSVGSAGSGRAEPAPVSSAGPIAAHASAPVSAEQTGAARAVAAEAAKKKPKVKKVTLKASEKSVHVGGSVLLTAQVTAKPKGKVHVAWQQLYPGTKKWRGAGTNIAFKSGRTRLRAGLSKTGTYKFRMVTAKKKSNAVAVRSTGPTPPVPPDPPAPPTTMSITWPADDNLEVDRQYLVPVKVSPAANVQVRIQTRDDSGWSDLYGGTSNTGGDGRVNAILSIPDTGAAKLRVIVVNQPQLTSDPVTKTFSDGGDAIYNIPMKLPNKRGVLVKAEEFPMTYPKLLLPNPLKKGENLLLPQIGNPAAGPPACVTDPKVARADCKIPGKQYRFMYTTERWYPDSDGGGGVQGGSQGATGLIMVPPNVKDNAPVVAWAHPTIGQANQCSISRGTDDIMVPGNPNPQPGGMDINLIDSIFFLDQMLKNGYIVVMPDYLGIGVNGPTANQKTYIVGPQEARDVYFAVDALQTRANKDKGWPGLPQAGNDFVVMGHSQGGHAALWTGILEDELGPDTGQNLKGVVAVAPATDINKLVDVQWNGQANWIIGPEVIQTWLGYLGGWAFQNNTISDAALNNLNRYEDYCTTQAFAASVEFFPNGMDQPGTAFMKDPHQPANQQAFYNWSRVFGKMIPGIKPGQSNSFPKDLPLELISGTGDQVVLSQSNAAMQEAFCSAGAQMSAYWTPVLTGVANTNPPKTDSLQAADHLNVLAFPWTDDVAGKKQVSAGALLQFTADRFAGKQMAPDCAQRQTTHDFLTPLGGTKQSWYVFPAGTNASKADFYSTGGSPLLPAPAQPAGQSINPAPAPGSVNPDDLSQSGCGYQYKKTGQYTYASNPDCYQWGLYPYGKLIYDDAVVGKTWGTYPFMPPKP